MPELTPEIANKVLGADLRNIVAKVSDGSTLSGGEREIVERSLADGALPDELQRARRAALLRSWAKGGRLGEEQLAEIRAFLPNGRSVSRQLTAERYQHPLKHYTTIVRRSERVLKGWIAHGRWQDLEKKIPRNPPDFPPFDEADQLEAWWGRCMKNTCPAILKELAAGGAPANTTAPSTPSSSPEGDPVPGDVGLTIPEFHGSGGGDSDSDLGIQYIRGMVQDGIKEMGAARKEGNAKRYWNARKQWEEDVETLRKWEKDLIKIQEGKGDVVRTRVMNQVLVSIFGVAAQSFTNALFALVRQLAPQLPAGDMRKIVLPHRDRVIAHIKKTRFAQAWEEAKLEILPPAA